MIIFICVYILLRVLIVIIYITVMIIYSITLFLFSCAINLKKDKSILYSRIFLLILLNTSIISYNLLYINYLNQGIAVFGGLFNITSINSLFNFFVFTICIFIGFITSFYPRKIWINKQPNIYNKLFIKFSFNNENLLNTMNEQYRITEYTLIQLFVITGGIFLMASNDIISVFLSIELQSYGLYILCSVYRNSESATSAGLTYFLLGALASCFILLSTAILYINSGCTSLENLYIITNLSELSKDMSFDNLNDNLIITNSYNPYYIHLSLVILSIGFLFKISAAPFHFWSPDVYDAVPTTVTTFIAIMPKITILIFILDIVNNTYKSLYIYNYTWTTIFFISSLLSLIIGTVLGLTQSRIKRLFAYSTISHLGFILLALTVKSKESLQAFIFYILQYSISNLNAFLILICIGYSLYLYVYKERIDNSFITYSHTDKNHNLMWKERNNSPIQFIDQLKGLYFINPVLALSLTITLFSFTGVPPLIGFFAKLMVLSSSIDSGYIFMCIVAIITSVIGGVYYLAIIKQIFFEKSNYKLNPDLSNLSLTGTYQKNAKFNIINFGIDNVILSSSLTILISIKTAIILLFIFTPSEVFNITSLLSIISFNY